MADGYDALVKAAATAPIGAEFAKRYAEAHAANDKIEPQVEIQSARDAPWDAVREVLVGAGEAGFVKLRFTARPAKRE